MHQVSLSIECPKCREKGSLIVEYDKFQKWQSGTLLVQEAFPDLNAADRERLISGWCDSCWYNIFGEEE
jgi:hypothetical protein